MVAAAIAVRRAGAGWTVTYSSGAVPRRRPRGVRATHFGESGEEKRARAATGST